MEDYSPEIQVALKIYLKGLLPFVNKCFEDVYGNNSIKKIKEIYYNGTGFAIKSREGKIRWDPYKISKFILINECRKFFTNYFETSDYKFIELILKTRNYASHPEFDGETDIYLKPGSNINSVDGLITNFHTPKSTLLLLVYAFIGKQKTKKLYKYAIKKKLRFFSYGDACLLWKT